jgi:hypothetical protein
MLSGSYTTSPVNSNHSGDTKVYEVTDFKGDEVEEVPAESAKSQLSMCQMGIRENAHLLSERLGKDWILPIYSTCSSIVCLVLSILMGAMFMSSSVQPPTARGGMVVMCTTSWTLVMQSPQVVFVGTQRCVGVMKQYVPLTKSKIWKAHMRSRRNLG